MNITQQILSRAADIIEQHGWTQGVYARNSNGFPVIEISDDAVCFCTLGAIKKASDEQKGYERGAIIHFSNHEGIRNIAGWNDDTYQTKENVIATLRKAAA